MYGRIARVLLDLAEEEDGRLVVKGKITQQSIAERAGCSREMVSRIITDLVRGGYIVAEKGYLVLNRRLPSSW